MDLAKIILENWVQLAVAAEMAAMFYYGWKSGLIRMLFSFLPTVTSFLICRALFPRVKELLAENSAANAFLEERIRPLLPQLGGAEAGDPNAEILYRMIGLDKLSSYLAEQLSNLLISALLFLILLLLVKVFMGISFRFLNLLAEAPGLSLINRSLGALLSLLQGLFYLWLLLILLSFLPENPVSISVAEQFSHPGSWLNYIREANLITRIFSAAAGLPWKI